MRLEPFSPEHLEEMGSPLAAIPSAMHRAALCAVQGPAYTGRDADGRIIGCAGVCIQRPGVGEAWAILGPQAQAHCAGIHRTAYRILRCIAAQAGLRRVQAAVDVAHPAHVRWIARLGFRCEGIMARFGPQGEPMALYAWLPEEGGRG